MLAFAATAMSSPFAIAGDKLPSGAKVMDNFVKSTGGKRAYQRIKNRVSKGKFTMPAMGMTMDLVRYQSEPNKLYTRMESEAMGMTVEQGVAGDVAWTVAMMGPQLLSGPQADGMKREAFFQNQVEWRRVYKEAKCVALTEFDGTDCYKVELTPNAGFSETAYFEKDTGLQRGSESVVENPMGEVKIITKIKGYKEVDGILLPHRIEQKMLLGGNSQEMVISFDSIEQNADIPKDRFELPEQVAALVKAKEKEGDKDASAKAGGKK